ncbi:MAG: hypothetical protein IKK91_06590, partial [Ruminococcus sp.]|nr:hypothetical protein [Ruminococcus sp.]
CTKTSVLWVVVDAVPYRCLFCVLQMYGRTVFARKKNMFIDTLKRAIKGSFSFNMPFPMNSGRQKSAGIQPPKTASGQDLKR